MHCCESVSWRSGCLCSLGCSEHPPPTRHPSPWRLGHGGEGRWLPPCLAHFPPGFPHVGSGGPVHSAFSSCWPALPGSWAGSELASCLDPGGPTGSKPCLSTCPPQPGHFQCPQEGVLCTINLHHLCRKIKPVEHLCPYRACHRHHQRVALSICSLSRISDPLVPKLKDGAPPLTLSFKP